MADHSPRRERREDAHLEPPPAPRWVKQLGVVALVLVVLFGLLHVTGRGFGRHIHMHGGEIQGPIPAGGGR
jgi:hypothetical protein